MKLQRHPVPARRARQHGIGLLEALVAVAILSLGLLGLARFQVGMIAQSTEAQSRMVAAVLGDELLNTVLVDTAHAACYTLPRTGTCTSDAAAARAAEWKQRALAALPGSNEVTSTLNAATLRFIVTLIWTGKSSADAHVLQMATDAR